MFWPRSEPELKLVGFDPNKHAPKTISEKLNDLFFVLFVLYKGEELGIHVTNGVLIKALFAAKISLSDEDLSFLNVGFYPYDKGPFNKKFYTYLDELSEAGLIQKDEYNLSLSPRGLSTVQSLIEKAAKVDKYKLVERKIEDSIKKCKDFHKTVDEMHKSMVLDKKTNKAITVQDAIDNPAQYGNSYFESIKEPSAKFVLSSEVINGLLSAESDVSASDYEEVQVLNNASQLLDDTD